MKQIVFCGCGGLYNYSLGVAKIIQKIMIMNNIDSNNIKFVGISGGCYPALLLSLKLDIDTMFNTFNKELLNKVSTFYLGSFFNWYKYLKLYSLKYIPNNCYKVKNLVLNTTNIFKIKNLEYNKWDNKNDLINCIIASSYIPLFSGGIYYKYKNNYCIDGTLSYNYNNYKDTNHILYIYPDKWRYNKPNWYYCYNDYKWARTLFIDGQIDAINNKNYILDFFKNT